MKELQEQFNSSGTGDFILPIGENKGPLTINRSCVVDGSGSTLWADNGPVLIINAPNVTIKNIRIEVTESSKNKDNRIAIKTNFPDTYLENVEVSGAVVGFKNESAEWNLPGVIKLGTFSADAVNTFSYEIDSPDNAKIISKMSDIEVSPCELIKGKNKLTFTTDKIKNNTILYGELLIQTNVIRRIYITGRSEAGAEIHNDEVEEITNFLLNTTTIIPPAEIIPTIILNSNVEFLKCGQRVNLRKYVNSELKIVFEYKEIKKNIDIDSYTFLLTDSGKVSCDEDLIFFGNTSSQDHSVKSETIDNKSIITISLSKVTNILSKVSVCFSIYGDNPSENFSLVVQPLIRIFSDNNEIFRFQLENLSIEKTIVGMEIYRYKGEWKLNCIGRGYKSSLRILCEDFGVNIE